jgi:hypothetical protein
VIRLALRLKFRFFHTLETLAEFFFQYAKVIFLGVRSFLDFIDSLFEAVEAFVAPV